MYSGWLGWKKILFVFAFLFLILEIKNKKQKTKKTGNQNIYKAFQLVIFGS